MLRKCIFADAVSEPQSSDFAIIGLPFDSTTSFRSGARDGPDAIRLASWSFETYSYRHDIDFQDLHVCDLGDMELGSDPAYAWDEIRCSIKDLPKGIVPIFLGGEHSITPPIVDALSRGRSLGVVVLDAHLDLRDEYGCTRFSHACASRRMLEVQGLAGYASIGIRSGSSEEFKYADEKQISYYTSDEVAERGMDAVLNEVQEGLGGAEIYLSIDFDVLDPGVAPAVGNPEPFGLGSREVRRVIEVLAPKVIAMDINEIAPAYDHGQTAILGAAMAREFIAAKARSMDKRY
ncbi:MAG TPA: agmatinase [Methanotrichaceae archaeon]|nr:agmatinase [Methanotrichaceae archaeon]